MEASTSKAVEDWRQLYGGELHALPEPAPGRSTAAVRCDDFRRDPGNWPKIFHHRRRTDRVLVLIHGLKDSPGYLEAIARRFAGHGVNVVLPLLPAHGRRDPLPEMRRVDYRDWRAAVDRTVEIAAALGDQLSIGGLSTGGALAIDKCLRDPSAVGGKVLLFAAALGLSPKARLVLASSLLCRMADAWTSRQDKPLRTARLRRSITSSPDGIGGNPVKYSRDFFAAGRQVYLLIEAIKRRAGADFERLASTLRSRIFVAHSEADDTIPAGAVKCLVEPGDPGQHHLVPRTAGVAHAELVLAEAMTYEKLRPGEPDPPRANPEFEPMIEQALAFLDRADHSTARMRSMRPP